MPAPRSAAVGSGRCATDDPGGRAADLPGFQKRIQTTVEKTLPTVVSFIGAAGVIISPEGLVLSQAHVTHPEGAKPGTRTRVFLHDGTAAEAELLGADRLHDVSVLRLTKPGPYPFAPLADRHPAGGLRAEDGLPWAAVVPEESTSRGPPRHGPRRDIRRVSDRLPDQRWRLGGPYFDLDGRVIGILKVSLPLLDEPAQEGKALFGRNLIMPRGWLWWWGTPSTLIRTRLARMEGRDSHDARARFSPSPAKGPVLGGDLLAEDRRTQGKAMLGRFRRAVTDARRSVVEILDGGMTTALGTVVDPDGLVLTKASKVPDRARCRCRAAGSLRPR